MICSLNKCSFIENYYFIYCASILGYLLLAIKAKGAFITSLTLITFLIATFIATSFDFKSTNCYIPFLFEDRFLAAFSSAIACILATTIALFSIIILSYSSFLNFFLHFFFYFFCNSLSFIFSLLYCFFLLLLLYICYLYCFKVLSLLHCLRAK